MFSGHRGALLARGGVLLLLLCSVLALGSRPMRAGSPPARFETAACPFTVGSGMVEGRDVRCGYLVVPENRARPAGPTVRLAVAIFKSPAPSPAPDPVIFLQGGPGGALVQDFGPAITAQAAPVIVGSRDLILLDQRGTGYSRPLLTCPELNTLKYQTLDENLSTAAQTALAVSAAGRCRARLAADGVDLSAFSTQADAADVADLRQVLGYKEVNLYGVSYGTRLALEIMRSYPQGVRSVVLDSVVPPQLDLFTSPSSTIQHALATLFAGCAADASCNAAYPHLSATFYALATRLDAHPVHLKVTAATNGKTYMVLVNGQAVIDIAFNALYQSPLISLLPQMIVDAAAGQYAPLVKMAGQVEFQFDYDISQAMYYSVECAEDAPFTSAAQITASAHGLPPELRTYVLAGSLGDLQVCASWGAHRAPTAERAPVSSAIPTLVLSGQYDPITPPWTGLLAAKTLTHSYTYSFPGIGHGVYLSARCPYRITADFLDDPTTRPAEAGCVAGMSGPTFALPSGSP